MVSNTLTPGTTGLLQQAYVTHCIQSDSVRGEAGYSIRAVSPGVDPEMMRFAAECPSYELPLDMWSSAPNPTQAPRRLAFVRLPNGAKVLLHTSYLEFDTRGRRNSYFAHLIAAPPGLTAADALRSWASPGWVLNWAQGVDPKLQATAHIPQGSALSDAALKGFLSDAPPRGDLNLSTLVCPGRLALPDPARRKQLLMQAMEGWLLVVENQATPRGRLYIHAEPGLVALLAYGIARLLPPGLTEDLTFSTFESAHRTVREFKLGLLVGTYIGNPNKALDPEYLQARGFGLDTFHNDRASQELKAPSPAVRELVEAAARGDWDLVKRLHGYWGNGKVPPRTLGEGIQTVRALERLEHGSPSVDDLLRLRQDPRCAAAMAQHEAKVWAVVGDPRLANNPQVRQAFAELFRKPQNLTAIRARAVQALTANDIPGWQANWDLLKSVCDAATLPAQFQQVLAAVPKPASAADRPRQRLLLSELLASGAADPNNPPYELLQPFAPDHLDETLRLPGLPPLWQAMAIRLGTYDPATAPAARRHLEASDAARADLYFGLTVKWSKGNPAEDLAAAFDKPTDATRRVFGHLLRTGTTHLAPDGWVWLLHKLDAYEGPGWPEFWQADNHLYELLVALKDSPEAASIWQYFAKKHVERSFAGGDAGCAEVYRQLTEAKEKVAGRGTPQFAPPPDVRDRLRDWDVIRRVMKAGEGDPAAWKEFDAACRRQNVDKAVLLADQLRRYGQLDPEKDTASFEPFVSLFTAFNPPMKDEDDYAKGAEYWLKTVALAQLPRPERFQAAYFNRFPPMPMRLPLLDKPNVKPLVSAAARDLVIRAFNQVKKAPDPVKAVSAAAGIPGGGPKRKLPKEFLIAVGVVTALVVGVVVAFNPFGGGPEDPGGGSTGKQDPVTAKVVPPPTKSVEKPEGSTKADPKPLDKGNKARSGDSPPPPPTEDPVKAKLAREGAEATAAAVAASTSHLKGLVRYVKPVDEVLKSSVASVPAIIVPRAKEWQAAQAKRKVFRKYYEELSPAKLVDTFTDGEIEFGQLRRTPPAPKRPSEARRLEALVEPLRKRNPFTGAGEAWKKDEEDHAHARKILLDQIIEHLIDRDLRPETAHPVDFRNALIAFFEQRVDGKKLDFYFWQISTTTDLPNNPTSRNIGDVIDNLQRSLKDNTNRK